MDRESDKRTDQERTQVQHGDAGRDQRAIDAIAPDLLLQLLAEFAIAAWDRLEAIEATLSSIAAVAKTSEERPPIVNELRRLLFGTPEEIQPSSQDLAAQPQHDGAGAPDGARTDGDGNNY